MVIRFAALALVACSGNKGRPPGDDAVHGPRGDAAVVVPADAAPTGEVAIRVEWKAVPVIARASPGLTRCHTPRAALVAPTTMWGIPDALVVVEGGGTVPAEARVTVSDCALAPRLVVGTTLIVESALDRPTKVMLSKHGDVAHLDGLKQPIASASDTRTIQLPIAGHAVSIALDAGGVYQLAMDARDAGEPAWIVAVPAVVTDAGGVATLRTSPGAHAVSAWLPARGGQKGKLTKSSVTVEANQLAQPGSEHVVDLGPP